MKHVQSPIPFPSDKAVIQIKGNIGVSSAIIDRDGLIKSYQLNTDKPGNLIPVDTTGTSIFDNSPADEAVTLLGLINYTISTGHQTEHIHTFRWHSKDYLRHATIKRKNGSDYEALLTIKPYP